jgi:hypothetical protein
MSPPWSVHDLPAVLEETVCEATGRSMRLDPVLVGTGGPAGNARLTAWTGLALLALSLAEVVTLLDVRGLISWHVVIGVLLVPPALVKTATTGWRIFRYYRSAPPYTEAGPPPLLLRLLGPAVVVSTLALLGSGLALVYLGVDGSHAVLVTAPGLRVDWVTVHQGTFIVWAMATGLHVLGRLVPALRLTLVPTAPTRVPGVRRRALVLIATGLLAVVASVWVLAASGSWQSDDRGGGNDDGNLCPSPGVDQRSAASSRHSLCSPRSAQPS